MKVGVVSPDSFSHKSSFYSSSYDAEYGPYRGQGGGDDGDDGEDISEITNPRYRVAEDVEGGEGGGSTTGGVSSSWDSEDSEDPEEVKRHRGMVVGSVLITTQQNAWCLARCFLRWKEDAKYLSRTWREQLVPAAFIIPLALEYFVVMNAYNANIFDFMDMPDETEYALMDVFVLVVMAISMWCFRIDPNSLELLGTLASLCAHYSWVFHSPFEEWRVGTPTEDDIRHRTEYYDTHVLCFAIYAVLFARRFPLPIRTPLKKDLPAHVKDISISLDDPSVQSEVQYLPSGAPSGTSGTTTNPSGNSNSSTLQSSSPSPSPSSSSSSSTILSYV